VKFEIGEVVAITNPSTFYTEQFRGQYAVVSNFIEGEAFPYAVMFSDGRELGFTEEELARVYDPAQEEDDEINHPSHYTWLPNGVEVIDITEHFNFTLGNALKYIMRAGHKHDEPLTDLRKAAWYINREIERIEVSSA
jgi:hypothetical protein